MRSSAVNSSHASFECGVSKNSNTQFSNGQLVLPGNLRLCFHPPLPYSSLHPNKLSWKGKKRILTGSTCEIPWLAGSRPCSPRTRRGAHGESLLFLCPPEKEDFSEEIPILE
ncbi:hypothetical protein NPIL_548431 [Nephila pilipes]|uniref:Uncharacterized protein n=1 Tax=Nephila pilipes TaxID=299642 RepID=A0A8X6U2R6_NEPPI|nr:hypothetical protein NPIL_548431 [Nephila pilipes]